VARGRKATGLTRLLFLGLALPSLIGTACGTKKSLGAPDSSAPQGREAGTDACGNKRRIECVIGSPYQGGFTCLDLGMPSSCVAGEWVCPKGQINVADCNCGPFGPSCPGVICTENGWECPDAGTDADARADADAHPDTQTDAVSCGNVIPASCVYPTRIGDIGDCTNVHVSPVCLEGRWKCPAGTISPNLCDAGAGGDASDARTDASCNLGCMRSTTPATFCRPGEIQWECRGQLISDVFRVACHDPGTDLQRYCCPTEFLSQCW
jgi:hypothetical protein